MNASEKLRMADYISQTGITLQEMRLLIEGAVYLYTEEASPLLNLARRQDQYELAESFSTISAALYNLRDLICGLQKSYIAETRRQIIAESFE